MFFIPKGLDQNILTITELLLLRRLYRYSGNVLISLFFHTQQNTEDKEATNY